MSRHSADLPHNCSIISINLDFTIQHPTTTSSCLDLKKHDILTRSYVIEDELVALIENGTFRDGACHSVRLCSTSGCSDCVGSLFGTSHLSLHYCKIRYVLLRASGVRLSGNKIAYNAPKVRSRSGNLIWFLDLSAF